jgi:hypothetical protein
MDVESCTQKIKEEAAGAKNRKARIIAVISKKQR